MGVERLAVHRVGNQNFSGMKTGIDLAQRQYGLVTIRARRHNVISERFAVQFTA